MPPYDRTIYSMTKPMGVKEIEGPRSAYKTAIVFKGPLQRSVDLDIGAFRARIKKSGKGRAKLTFVRDTGESSELSSTR